MCSKQPVVISQHWSFIMKQTELPSPGTVQKQSTLSQQLVKEMKPLVQIICQSIYCQELDREVCLNRHDIFIM